jgi:hypothetical protein
LSSLKIFICHLDHFVSDVIINETSLIGENMSDFAPDNDKKNLRRKNLQNKSRDRKDVDDNIEARKFYSKELKQKKSRMREEELWDDWESDNYA